STAYEIIVADSTPNSTVADVVAAFPGSRLVRSSTALLPGAARNLGAQHARGAYLAFIDADCVPEPDWLATALAALQAGVKIVGGSILDAYPFHPIAVSDNMLQFADFPRQRPSMVAFVKFLVYRRRGRTGPFGSVFPNAMRLTISEKPFLIARQSFTFQHTGGVTGVEQKMSRTTFYPCWLMGVARHQMLHSPRDNTDSALVSGPI
ncbi:MAG: glycosyltransferase family 2 protein, partial [Shimia sp.]|nr:glycosyltransferase family 2 protein [Shimia sp.]